MLIQAPLRVHTMAVTFSLFVLLLPVQAYIPAIPTNDTALAIANGLNVTDTSRLNIEWGSSNPSSSGAAFQTISYQVVGRNNNDSTKGVFVHFSEDDISGAANDITTTPWIALISCDANSTRASQFSDVFTLAYQRGALGALLYSAWSQACIINPEYKDSRSDNNQLMDVFSTQSLASARLILGLFSNLGDGADGEYNPSTLNASKVIINQSLEEGTPAELGYLFSTLVAHNATAPSSEGDGLSATSPEKETTLAMKIFYSITGFIVGFYLL